MTCGIYLIQCNRFPYVGQSIEIEARWKAHVRLLVRGAHTNSIMQRTWDKYGGSTFKFKILEVCEPEQLTEREQYWCDHLNTYEDGCNFAEAVDSPWRGRELLESTKLKLSAAMRDRVDPKRRFSEHEVIRMWWRYMDGETCASIADDLGVSDKVVWNIVNRRYYREIELPDACRQKERRRAGGGRKKKI